MKLTSQNVHNTFMTCLFKDEEVEEGKIPDNAILVKSVIINIGFHSGRLNKNKENIIDMIMQLPKGFHENKGGMSFLNACNDKNGNQWTGMHKIMDELVALGIGIKFIEFQLPREMWKILPGGMPYFIIKEN